jgi:hypothetical protein
MSRKGRAPTPKCSTILQGIKVERHSDAVLIHGGPKRFFRENVSLDDPLDDPEAVDPADEMAAELAAEVTRPTSSLVEQVMFPSSVFSAHKLIDFHILHGKYVTREFNIRRTFRGFLSFAG